MVGGNEFDLKQLCSNYAEKYGYKRDHVERGLESYAVHLFAQEEGFNAVLEGNLTSEVDLSEYICRHNDLQIDGVLEDEAGKRLLLVQATWRGKTLDESKLEAFFDVPDRILRKEYSETGGDQIQDLLSGFVDKVSDGYEIILRFVTNLNIGNRERLLEATDAKNLAYETADRNIVCELYGQSELAKRADELEKAVTGGLVDEVTLHFQKEHLLELYKPYRTLVGVIKANEIVDLYLKRTVRNALFNLNIRLPLASKKVNPRIVDTAASDAEGEHFFYYNNGVSAVCSGYTRDDSIVTAKRFQIINGAQTVNALVMARRRNPNPNVYVLFRLTETKEGYGGDFTQNIIRYNNTQNPVKVADFFSNDKIQLWLRDNFIKISGRGPIPTVYYIYKSGYKPKGATGKGVKIETLAGIRHAFIYGPVMSYRAPAQFFDREGAYHEAFGVEGKPAVMWPDEELYRFGAALAIHDRVQAIARKLRSGRATKDIDEAKYLYRLARYVTGLAGAGLEAIREEAFHDYATLTASSATFNEHVAPIIDEARAVLRHEWKRRKGSAVQPEYNLARDEETWVRLKDSLREDVLARLV